MRRIYASLAPPVVGCSGWLGLSVQAMAKTDSAHRHQEALAQQRRTWQQRKGDALARQEGTAADPCAVIAQRRCWRDRRCPQAN